MKQTHSAHERLSDLAGFTGRIVLGTMAIADEAWRRYAMRQNATATLIWPGIWGLEALEAVIDQLPESKYPSRYPAGEGDIFQWRSYGRGFDLLCLGTHEILGEYRVQLAELAVPPIVVHVSN